VVTLLAICPGKMLPNAKTIAAWSLHQRQVCFLINVAYLFARLDEAGKKCLPGCKNRADAFKTITNSLLDWRSNLEAQAEVSSKRHRVGGWPARGTIELHRQISLNEVSLEKTLVVLEFPAFVEQRDKSKL
jgi:hypothetical protein